MKRRYKIIAILLFVIVVARLSLPFLLKNYINTQLSTLEGYYGYVNDVDLKLLTGSYCLENFNIDEDNGQLKTPFISAEKVKLSIDWKSLLKGKVVGEINISNGRVNYVLQEQKDIRDSTDLKKWYELAQDMMPIQLNRVDITNAEIIYADHFKGDPFEVKMSNIDLLAENLSNVIHPDDTFPSQFALKGQIMGHGYIWTEGRMNVLKDTPDVQVDLRVEKVNITELNLIFQKYFGVDVYSGIFNNYSEFNMLDGKIDGYTKPIVQKLDIKHKNQDAHDQFYQKIYESTSELVPLIFNNKKAKQVGSKIPFSGSLKDPDFSWLATGKSFLRNAFIEPLSLSLEKS